MTFVTCHYLNTGNVVNFDTTDLKPANGFGGLVDYPFSVDPRSSNSVCHLLRY
jgi:hypothetical protein